MNRTLDWLIIGGGIQGVHIAARLIADAGVSAEQLRIVDPGARLLERWRCCTATTGMKHLRSPAVHHLDLSPWSLRQFAGRRAKQSPSLFAAPYDRPSLSLFNAHCDEVIETFRLNELHIRAHAIECSVECESTTIKLSTGGDLRARNVVLAIGAGDQATWPDWAPRNDPRIQHVFAPDFDGWPSKEEVTAIVGGGISAGQIALRLTQDGHRVHLIARHALRQHQFDSDPGWLGPKHMSFFHRQRDPDRRRELISAARHKGSVPPDLHSDLQRAIRCEQLAWHQGEVVHAERDTRVLTLQLASGDKVHADRLLLATGFLPHRPGGELVDKLVQSAALPCASCGYPIVDTALRWHARIFVAGPLAELELGPVARNIAGARRAADRIIDAARTDQNIRGGYLAHPPDAAQSSG